MDEVEKMSYNIDIIIIASFLAINLVAGFYSGRGIKTIKEYAIGNRNFSTATIAATIIATWISGSFFTVCVGTATIVWLFNKRCDIRSIVIFMNRKVGVYGIKM